MRSRAVEFGRDMWTRRRPAVVGGVPAVVVVVVVVWWLWPQSAGPLEMHAGTPERIVTVTVERPRLGSSDIAIALADREGKAVEGAVIRIDAVDPRMGMAEAPVTAVAAGSGRYLAAAVPFMSTGQWELRMTVDDTGTLVLPVWIGG
ncbi:FixH family protein [Nocardia sp. alder85J]|uniref:FixH family protein n=1 Tax=Nocardia sp. alder85J TaxID=2862949 RepID=UPI001CD5F1CD|nr:FixH family protein [Nocardia sp. alder85J]MCX4098240.1 FixH family protein [Nocardia sp. alder85J]